MSYLNFISFFGIFGVCFIAWLFSENKRVVPWRTIGSGIGLQLFLAILVFQFPPTRIGIEWFSGLLDGVFLAADAGARFVFGRNIVPIPGTEPAVNIGYIFAFRALPTVIFFSGFMALLYNLGIIQVLTNVFAKLFYYTMRLSGAEALSGAANIFVGIEAAIVVKPFIEKMTRSELCAILSCCFGTAASSTLAIYVSFLKPVFPNILGHLVSASIMAIPACFVISKILVPETEHPLTMGMLPAEEQDEIKKEEAERELEDVGGEKMQRVSPLDAAIIGALDGVKMSVSIAAVLILIVGLVSLINQLFGWLGAMPGPIGSLFQVITLQNIQGALFLPLTFLTGVEWSELWTASVLIGRRLLETAIPSYGALAEAANKGEVSPRTVLIVSYALSGFAHLASVGIFVGGTIALAPSRRQDISRLGWKALFAGTLATIMIACLAGTFDNGNPSIIGTPETQTSPAIVAPANTSPSPSPSPSATPSVSPTPSISPKNNTDKASPAPAKSPTGNTDKKSPASSPSPTQSPR
jgi:CNT family concentrative nucleoside transporter